MEKKTIRDLTAISSTELIAYLQSLPEEEQRAIDEELNKAIEAVTSRNLVDKRNQNATS
jgi:hypothetical protein